NPAGSTLIQLGSSGAFLGDSSVSSSDPIILDFQNTGVGGTSSSSPNIYDLVEFADSTGSGPNGSLTNLTISDFDMINLDGALANGDPTLSFVDLGGGLEALQLSVVPEPSTWAMIFGGLAFLGLLVRGRLRLRNGVVRSLR
ncbi:MAG TPA: PEP-CTERM sorting domain-containing protein, partial [Candidatus Methylacidiphilales bacterium]|nr:PEP-CTERM sorting domain-containing protein [Candidatus Methylacidiphilales bacterium]